MSNHLAEAILMSTQNICFNEELKKRTAVAGQRSLPELSFANKTQSFSEQKIKQVKSLDREI